MTPAELAFLATLCAAPAATGENPLPVIQQLESQGQNIKNYRWDPGHTATSEGQITNSTWNSIVVPVTGFPEVGPGTPYVNGVMDLQKFQRTVGIAVLYDTDEFKHWTCEGCNADLRELVKERGPDVFKPVGSLTANPCALAQYINEKPKPITVPKTKGKGKPEPVPTPIKADAPTPNRGVFAIEPGVSGSSFVVTSIR